MLRTLWLDQLAQDVRFAWRGMCQSPAYVSMTVVTLAVNAQRARPVTGASAMLDEIAYAITPIEPGATGSVRTHGEIWSATADEPIEAGSPVRVTAVNGLLLRVAPVAKRIET